MGVVSVRPIVRYVTVSGLRYTREELVRREVAATEGSALEAEGLRETRRRLEETGLFRRIDLGVKPIEPGYADLEVQLSDRHGFGPPLDVLARAGLDLTRKRITTRYTNVGGRGVSLGASYRWERTQPSIGFEVDAVRPFGLGINLRAAALRARPTYDIDDDGRDPFTLRTRGADFGLRRVLGARTTVEAGLHYRNRTYTVVRSDTPSGRVSALQLGVERRLIDAARHRLDLGLAGLSASPAWGSDLSFARALVRAGYRASLAAPEAHVALQRSELAAQVFWGLAGSGTPLDEMFAPGAASQMEFPLRAHRQKRGGVLGRGPIGRRLALANVEWRQRLIRSGTFQVGMVVFTDTVWVGETARGGGATFYDVGAGLRLGRAHSTILRADFAYSPRDGKTSLTAGIGQVF
jgi:hypothetical protein